VLLVLGRGLERELVQGLGLVQALELVLVRHRQLPN